MVGKPAALIGKQVTEAGPDQRPRSVEPYSLALTGERLGLDEPSCDMAWQATGASAGAGREDVVERKDAVGRKDDRAQRRLVREKLGVDALLALQGGNAPIE